MTNFSGNYDGDQAFTDREICGPHCDSRILHAPGECKNLR